MNGNFKYQSYFDDGPDSPAISSNQDPRKFHLSNLANSPHHPYETVSKTSSGPNAAPGSMNPDHYLGEEVPPPSMRNGRGGGRDTSLARGANNRSVSQQRRFSSGYPGGHANAIGSVSSLPGLTAEQQQRQQQQGGESGLLQHQQTHVSQVPQRPRSRSMSFNVEKHEDSNAGKGDQSGYLPHLAPFRPAFEEHESRSNNNNMLLIDSFNTSNSTLDTNGAGGANIRTMSASGNGSSAGLERSRYRAISSHGKRNMSNQNQGASDQYPQPENGGRKSEQDTSMQKLSAKLAELDFVATSNQSNGDFLDGLISKIPDQRRNIVAKRGSVFTLMMAGESGLGKSTMINTLFGDRFEETNKDHHHHNQHHAPLESNLPKTTRIEVREAVYVEKGFPVKFTVIDTPGFGDYTNNMHCWVPIINYIDNQHKLYMLQEEQPDRRKKVDTRVHACLYFIRPSGKGLLPLDIKVMQELSTRVNLIPVLAKADSFTLKDREYFKQQVRETIASSGIEIYCPQDVNPEIDEDIRHMPYAVIASEHIIGTDEFGRPVRGRPYRWGIAQVENEDHCDFVKLRRVLMEKHMLDLVDSTIEKHYQLYRKNCMIRRIEHARSETLDTEGAEVAKKIDLEGGLHTLVYISKYGKDFLEDGQLENDPIFREQQRKINDRFAVIVAFHEDRFESWRNELRKKQDELNLDIENASKGLDELQAEIDLLESNRDFEPERFDRESRGFGKVSRYGMRK